MAAISILIVEDDRIISRLLAEMLREMGHTVCVIAATEEEAVTEAVRHKPDLMIVDQHLRVGTGMSAVERISRIVPVPHIFLTGAPMQLRQATATVLLKPFCEEDLARAIERTVHGSDAPASGPLNFVDPPPTR